MPVTPHGSRRSDLSRHLQKLSCKQYRYKKLEKSLNKDICQHCILIPVCYAVVEAVAYLDAEHPENKYEHHSESVIHHSIHKHQNSDQQTYILKRGTLLSGWRDLSYAYSVYIHMTGLVTFSAECESVIFTASPFLIETVVFICVYRRSCSLSNFRIRRKLCKVDSFHIIIPESDSDKGFSNASLLTFFSKCRIIIICISRRNSNGTQPSHRRGAPSYSQGKY